MCLLDSFYLGIPVSDLNDEKNFQKIYLKIATDDYKVGNEVENSFRSLIVIATTSGQKKRNFKL